MMNHVRSGHQILLRCYLCPCIWIRIVMRRLAAGDVHLDTMPFLENIGGINLTDPDVVDLIWNHEFLLFKSVPVAHPQVTSIETVQVDGFSVWENIAQCKSKVGVFCGGTYKQKQPQTKQGTKQSLSLGPGITRH